MRNLSRESCHNYIDFIKITIHQIPEQDEAYKVTIYQIPVRELAQNDHRMIHQRKFLLQM